MKSLCVFSLFAASAVILAGCGGESAPETLPVTGSVSFDGTPVTQGEIVFRDAAGQTRSCGGQITDGKFSFDASPGSKKVEITARREVPGKMDTSNPGEEVPLMEQYIPASYNTETTLTADVSSDKKTFDFDLQSGG
jgi:hypothetical protein